MKNWIKLLLIFVMAASFSAFAKKKKKVKYRQVQKVNFDGDSIEGVARNPFGSYLMQKKATKFLPLYKLSEGFEKKIHQSVEYLP